MKIVSFPLLHTETDRELNIHIFLEFTNENFQNWIDSMNEYEDWGSFYNDGLEMSDNNWNWNLLTDNPYVYPKPVFLEHTEKKYYSFI